MRIYLEVLGKNAHSNFFNMESFLRLIACLLTPDFSAISAMLIPLKQIEIIRSVQKVEEQNVNRKSIVQDIHRLRTKTSDRNQFHQRLR